MQQILINGISTYILPAQNSHVLRQEQVLICKVQWQGFPSGSVVKKPPVNADLGLNPDLGRTHVPQKNQVHDPQLLSLCSGARESQLLSHMLQLLKQL